MILFLEISNIKKEMSILKRDKDGRTTLLYYHASLMTNTLLGSYFFFIPFFYWDTVLLSFSSLRLACLVERLFGNIFFLSSFFLLFS